MTFNHISVLANEVIEQLDIKPDGIYIDGTAGGGGHSSRILEHLTTGRLLCIDRDPDAVKTVTERFKESTNVTIVKSNFSEMAAAAADKGFMTVNGILLDLGVSSYQLDTRERGFSYHGDDPLDMRMSREGITAAEFIDTLDIEALTKIIRDYGEEAFAYRIATAIKKTQQTAAITTTGRLAEIISGAVPAAKRRDGHPARKTFQAIRIALNDELNSLTSGIASAFELLKSSGRLAIITFHSLEDRPVKQAFKEYTVGCTCPSDFPVCVCGKTPKAKLITKKPITPGDIELAQNPRSRSAKLRVLEKI